MICVVCHLSRVTFYTVCSFVKRVQWNSVVSSCLPLRSRVVWTHVRIARASTPCPHLCSFLHRGPCVLVTPYLTLPVRARLARGPCKARCLSAAHLLRAFVVGHSWHSTTPHSLAATHIHTYPATLMHTCTTSLPRAHIPPRNHTHTVMDTHTTIYTRSHLCRP